MTNDAHRLVLVDDIGGPLVLRVYGPEPTPLATVEVAPLRALALAADMVEAARRRLAGQVPDVAVCATDAPRPVFRDIGGQTFTIVEERTHQRRDGRASTFLVLEAPCATCGDTFRQQAAPKAKYLTRRCPKHRAPGVKVRRVGGP